MTIHPDALEARLVELEARLAFQEHALAELSDALAEARADGARTTERLRMVVDELRHARAGLSGDAGEEPPPPHY